MKQLCGFIKNLGECVTLRVKIMDLMAKMMICYAGSVLLS